jgi:hypothetical protein
MICFLLGNLTFHFIICLRKGVESPPILIEIFDTWMGMFSTWFQLNIIKYWIASVVVYNLMKKPTY